MIVDNDFYMNLALQEAWKYQGLTYPNPAVGCCITDKNGKILAVEAHKKAGYPHAEVEALKNSYVSLTGDETILSLINSAEIHNYLLKNHNGIFSDLSLYTTLEPCSHTGKTPSCANLIASLGIKKVFIGTDDLNKEAANGKAILLGEDIQVFSDILNQECKQLLEPFNRWKKDKFVLFKWAQRVDGTIDGGIISSKKSRENVHAMRDLCDLLVIGGNTVRIDRPTLDARLVNGRAPDVLILSKEKEFDKTIPLFEVENREVFIESDLSKIEEYNNIIIEGTSSLYELLKDYIDWNLCYIAPHFHGEQKMQLSDKMSILHSELISGDMKLWMKKEI